MKLVTYEVGGQLKLGAVIGDRVADLAALAQGSAGARYFRSVRSLLEGGSEAIAAAEALLADASAKGTTNSWPSLATLKLKAPVPDPQKILALAGNYREHIREGGGTVIPKERQVPQVFIKPITCVIGTEEAIRLPGPICTSVDYEAELGIVIGKTCHDVNADEAIDHVAGYLNFNDISGRRLNVDVSREVTARTSFFDWLNGKWFDTFAPIGPFLVLRDEIPDPQALDLQLRVNGQVRQEANTADMIFNVAETVAWISQFVTLEPGDIIATGTPSGVGSATKTFLQAGDVVEMEISGLGVLRNTVSPSI